MTDEQIIALYWARSERAIEETNAQYGNYIGYIAYRILRDSEDAKEIVNDTYLKAWNSIPPAKPNPLKAFLGRIARNLSINRLEANTSKKRGGGQYELILDELEECIPDDDSEFTSSVALRDLLNAFLRTLPDEQRRIFVRRYWYMDPISVIAKDFGVGESKVKMTLLRTRDKLRDFLEKEGFRV